MEFVKKDSIIYTNLGMGNKIDEQLINAGHDNMLKARMIIETYFGRGSDELVNRVFRTVARETLDYWLFCFQEFSCYHSVHAYLPIT